MKQTFIAIVIALFLGLAAQCQQLGANHIYGHERLFFNDLIVLGNHKILRVQDRMHESNRKMFLLDQNNLVTDTLLYSAITDLITLSDSSFTIWDVSCHVNMEIKENRFVLSKMVIIYSDFKKELGLEFFIDKFAIGQKYIAKTACSSFRWASLTTSKVFSFLRTASADETGIYKVHRNDKVNALMIKPPHNYIGLKKSIKDSLKLNQEIKTFELLASDDICRQRTKEYYGWDNFEKEGDNLYLYEKNSCSVYTFNLKEQLKLISQFQLPVNDPHTESWKYFFDFNSKQHFAVRRVKETEITNGKKASGYTFHYFVYHADLEKKELSLLQEGIHEPVAISDGLVYAIIRSEKGNNIYAFPINKDYRFEKSILIE